MHILKLKYSARKALFLLTLLLVALAMGKASALDYNDIRELMRNKVPEEVIINVVLQGDPLDVSIQQIQELRAMGASQRLVDLLMESYLDLDDVKQLLVNKVPERAIINVVRQSKVAPFRDEELEQLRAFGATEALLGALLSATQALDAETYARVGDGTGTVLTTDDLNPGSPYYVEGSGVTVYSSPEVVVTPPTVIYENNYYTDYPDGYYNYLPLGGYYYYSRGSQRDRRHPPPPPREEPPPSRPRPPSANKPKPPVEVQQHHKLPTTLPSNPPPRPPAVRPTPENKPPPSTGGRPVPPAGQRPSPGINRPPPPSSGARPPSSGGRLPPPAVKPETKPSRPQAGNRPSSRPSENRPTTVKPEKPDRSKPPSLPEKPSRPSRSPGKSEGRGKQMPPPKEEP